MKDDKLFSPFEKMVMECLEDLKGEEKNATQVSNVPRTDSE